MTEDVEDALKKDESVADEKDWSSSGGCGPAMDAAEAWTRMGDTCCGNETDDPDSH